MALGVPKKGEHDMKGANAIMVRPIAGGALADDYYMGESGGGSPSSPTSGLLGLTAGLGSGKGRVGS